MTWGRRSPLVPKPTPPKRADHEDSLLSLPTSTLSRLIHYIPIIILTLTKIQYVVYCRPREVLPYCVIASANQLGLGQEHWSQHQ